MATESVTPNTVSDPGASPVECSVNSCEANLPTAWVGAYFKLESMNWEYMVREFNVEDSERLTLLEDFLNVSGADGWELISVASTPTANFTHVVYLKRGLVLAEKVGFPLAID